MKTWMRIILICVATLLISVASFVAGRGGLHDKYTVAAPALWQKIPDQAFSHPPKHSHDPASFVFTLDQLDHYYRVPGEFTHRLVGDKYGFEALSFLILETHSGGGPGLHVHDVEEAHVLLKGSAQYRLGDQTFIVKAPYVARVPAGVPHTFINVGHEPFNLVAVFASKNPTTTRIGPNPLIFKQQTAIGTESPTSPK